MARAGGRGSAYAVAVLLLGLACLFEADAAVHTVGGAKGWDLGVDFTSWAKGETFAVGDVLFFPYTQTEHNVVVVSKAGYDACSGGGAISTYSAGNDNVTLTSAGTHYYLCSVVGHCSGGMKLAVTVAAAAAAPAPPPAAATKTPPSPAPPPAAATKTPPSPAPSSIKAPVAPPPTAVPSAEPPTPPAAVPSAEAPTPSSTSAPAPAPAPAPGTAPASAPTPGAAPATAPASTPSVGTPPTTSPTPTATIASPPSPPNAAPSLLTSAGALALALSVASVVAL